MASEGVAAVSSPSLMRLRPDGRPGSPPPQDEFEVESPFEYCEGAAWIISADTGIHPNDNGYSRFASALAAVVKADGLGPGLR